MAAPWFDPSMLLYAGALLLLISYVAQTPLQFRYLALAGLIVILAYGVALGMGQVVAGAALGVATNTLMIWRQWRDGHAIALSDDELNLFRNLRGLSSEQFRKLMKVGTWVRSAEPVLLTREGHMPEELYYVLEGSLSIQKSGREIKVQPAAFIGELAYLREMPATATVRLLPPGLFVSWKHAELNRVLAHDEALRLAMAMLINNDLAEKVARS
jgi:hypothetical protein